MARMWNDLTQLGVSAPDTIIRTVAVYLALAVLIRLAGTRDLAQLPAFDLVVVLLLSNVVPTSIIVPDASLLGGLIGAVVLVGLNSLIVRGGFGDTTAWRDSSREPRPGWSRTAGGTRRRCGTRVCASPTWTRHCVGRTPPASTTSR